jgi:hypothetical protein
MLGKWTVNTVKRLGASFRLVHMKIGYCGGRTCPMFCSSCKVKSSKMMDVIENFWFRGWRNAFAVMGDFMKQEHYLKRRLRRKAKDLMKRCSIVRRGWHMHTSKQGRWTVMETRKTVLGPEYPDTLSSMAGLSDTYQGQGRWTEALLGPEHPSILINMSNLANIFRMEGR